MIMLYHVISLLNIKLKFVGFMALITMCVHARTSACRTSFLVPSAREMVQLLSVFVLRSLRMKIVILMQNLFNYSIPLWLISYES